MLLGLKGQPLWIMIFQHLARYRWRLDKNGYVLRKAKGKRIYLHHIALPGDRYPAFVRDHVNRDKMDNRAANLRWLTREQSAQNKGPYRRKHNLGLRGVIPSDRKYRATVTVNGHVHRLGRFTSPDIAAMAASDLRRRLMPFSHEG